MFYRDEDRSMKELQESALFTVFTADEGALGKKKKDIFVLLNIWNLNNLNFKLKLRDVSLCKRISAAYGISEPAL